MAISATQLQTWANAPTSGKIQQTYEQIKKALEQSEALKIRDYEIYLQGSYANSTNIRVDSDIDIIVQLNSTFNHNISRLPLEQQQLFHQTFSNATYHWTNFREDVINALVDYFGANLIQLGNKSIKLAGNDYRVNADVVPCLQHREYNSFTLWNKDNFIGGMKFWTINENKEIINYPKIHKKNAEDKNGQHHTDSMFKDLVRITKNIKRRLVENNGFDPKVAPSYFVECAIYNAPDEHFQSDYQNTMEYILDFILRRCNTNQLITISHQHYLFGLESWQWNIKDAGDFFTAVENFYNNENL